MESLDLTLAKKLLKINAIMLQPDSPFMWANGWNAPIYNDNKITLSYPDVRRFVKVELSRLIMENFPQAQVVASVAMGSIAMGALVADTLGLPFVYVRDMPKDHGLENLIEGDFKPGQKVVLIEDLVSTAATPSRHCMRCSLLAATCWEWWRCSPMSSKRLSKPSARRTLISSL